jgi:hypothetical protein
VATKQQPLAQSDCDYMRLGIIKYTGTNQKFKTQHMHCAYVGF